MNTRAFLAILAPALVLAATQTQAQEGARPEAQVFAKLSDMEVERRVDAVIAEIATHPEVVGMAVAVARGDALIVDRGYGIADLQWNMPVGASTIFGIGSQTRQSSAAAIRKLAEQRKLGLDDPLRRYVPESDPGGRTVTIRQLVDHTSGI